MKTILLIEFMIASACTTAMSQENFDFKSTRAIEAVKKYQQNVNEIDKQRDDALIKARASLREALMDALHHSVDKNQLDEIEQIARYLKSPADSDGVARKKSNENYDTVHTKRNRELQEEISELTKRLTVLRSSQALVYKEKNQSGMTLKCFLPDGTLILRGEDSGRWQYADKTCKLFTLGNKGKGWLINVVFSKDLKHYSGKNQNGFKSQGRLFFGNPTEFFRVVRERAKN